MKTPLALLTVLLVSSFVQAQEGPCGDANSEVDRKACLQEAIKTADVELNRVYQLVIKKIKTQESMDPEAKKRWEDNLREGQRSWLKFKDGDCDAAAYEVWPWQCDGLNYSDVSIREN